MGELWHLSMQGLQVYFEVGGNGTSLFLLWQEGGIRSAGRNARHREPDRVA